MSEESPIREEVHVYNVRITSEIYIVAESASEAAETVRRGHYSIGDRDLPLDVNTSRVRTIDEIPMLRRDDFVHWPHNVEPLPEWEDAPVQAFLHKTTHDNNTNT